MSAASPSRGLRPGSGAAFAGPAVAIFLSSNLVNVGNLGFNVLFSHWLGPALFGQLATLLTLFLAVMGILGALQLAVSKRIAEGGPTTSLFEAGLDRLSRRGLIFGIAALPMLIGIVLMLDLGQRLGLGSGALLPLLLLCLPFALPLALVRGQATGRLDARGLILSAQVEVWVRLIGAVVAWIAGLGLAGVTFAIAVSVLTGWLPLRRIGAPVGSEHDEGAASLQGLILVALPFAVLQVAQSLLLDGDVLLAQALLGPEDAGHVAALMLFQRIQFYGCFSLAVVLLPAVTTEVSSGRNPMRAAAPVFALYLAVSAVVIAAACLSPELLIRVLVGQAFLPAATELPTVSLAAAVFTLNYLLATYLAAIGDRSGIWAMALACPLQLAAMTGFADTLATLVSVKLSCQLALAAWLSFRVLRPMLQSRRPDLQPVSR